MYSPHSWVGVVFLGFWLSQFVAGMYSYTISTLEVEIKRTFSKYHKFLGKFVYGLGLVTCALGFQDMQSSDLSSSTPPGYMSMDMGTNSTGNNSMSNMNMSMPGMNMRMAMNMTMDMASNVTLEGYYPDSNLAQYSSACCLLLILAGLFTFFTFVR